MSASGRARTWSAVLFALPWPLPTYALVGSVLIVVNEQVLGAHVFDASRLAAGAALAALLVPAWWAQRQHPAEQPRER